MADSLERSIIEFWQHVNINMKIINNISMLNPALISIVL